MTMLANSPEGRDIRYHFHPSTNAHLHQEVGPLVIERGDGVYVEDSSGKRYIEAMAGLWSAAVGFSEHRLAEAAARQMARLPFYHSFNHRAHSPVIDLAEKLVEMAPVPMSRAFFTNSGSEANDTAMKLVWYRANAMGQPQRKKIISRHGAFHGVTVAAASLTGLPNNHLSFDLPLSHVRHTARPHHWRDGRPGESEEDYATRLADELEALIQAEGPETVAAFIAEPVMGAGGVLVPPATYWAKIQAVLRRHDILFIADEVICGFGRTGRMFGSQTYGLTPDILVLSKALSSSYMPIAALLVNDRVFAPVAAESGRIGVFGHGFTASGHPVAAAVSLENLKIIEERDLVGHAAQVGAHMLGSLRELGDHALVGEVRGVGLMAAVELVADKATKAPWGNPGALGKHVVDLLLAEGVIARHMGDAIALSPPLIITPAQVDQVVAALRRALDAARRAVESEPRAA
jgi:4-aminobutyrate--pyruvate transaminase